MLTILATSARAEDAQPAKPPAAPAPAAKPAPPLTPEQAADAVLAALKANDDAALKDLAAKDDPDPWLVADELIRRGEHDGAEAFAKAAPRVDVEKLPEYVASRRGKADDAGRRERLAKANAALLGGKPDEAVGALGEQEPGPIEDVVGVRLAMGRGLAAKGLGHREDAVAVFQQSALAAGSIGWLARAARAHGEAGITLYEASDFAPAQAAWSEQLALCERRADKSNAAAALMNIGLTHQARGDYAAAIELYERALAAQEVLGDRAGAATTLGNAADTYELKGDHARALAMFRRALTAYEALGDAASAARALCAIVIVQPSASDTSAKPAGAGAVERRGS